ncbi:MAG: thiamine pyrophosphate-dependent enzyme [Sedimentitalea sp.]|uniref:thiamine pyrophosphate-dependent enzyme n=1 Tax=Sedimentitalea sp. TaxID=2048915 RepID=UPI003265A094
MSETGGSDGAGAKQSLDEPKVAPNRRGSVFGLSMEPARFEVERPVEISPPRALFGSDLVVETLRELDIPFVAMKSHRSLGEFQDSLVNYLGNTRPQLLSCLDDDVALAIACGFAKVTGKAMAAAQASAGSAAEGSALAHAFHDQTPLLILHPVPQGQVAPPPSGFLLSDLRPGDAADARSAMLTAIRMAEAVPKGPVRVTLLQDSLRSSCVEPDVRRNLQRYRARVNNGAARKDVAELAAILLEAERPLILAGSVSRSDTGWKNRIILAEILGAHVCTNSQSAAAFPTDHPLFIGEECAGKAENADVILSLEWPDLSGVSYRLHHKRNPVATIVEVSADVSRKRAAANDGMSPTPSDVLIEADADSLVCDLIEEMRDICGPHQSARPVEKPAVPQPGSPAASLSRPLVSLALAEVLEGEAVTVATAPEDWDVERWTFRGPLDFLGAGSGGPAQAVGSALALIGRGRIALGVVEADTFLAEVTALWTAVHYRIPVLLVVVNDTSGVGTATYQRPIAKARARNAANAWIGHRIDSPGIDIRGIAESFGASGIRVDKGYTDLCAALEKALHQVCDGGVAIVDVRLPAVEIQEP